MVNKCENYGIPVMAVTAVGREMEKREARYLAMCCRIAAELGARVVKTYWCEKDFDKVVEGCPVPVVIAGGPKCKTELEMLKFVHDGMEKGAIGINLGGNVWQSQHPVAIARALAHKPALLLADEPTGNLDDINAWEIVQLLLKINQFGTTVLLATHAVQLVNKIQKRVVTLEAGEIMYDQEKGKYLL